MSTSSMNDKQLLAAIDQAIENFKGDSSILMSAIGACYFGRRVGWKPLLLMHDKRTLAKYEKILGLNFRELMPEEGELAEKSLAWRASKNVTNFWKAVKGEIPGIRSPEVTR